MSKVKEYRNRFIIFVPWTSILLKNKLILLLVLGLLRLHLAPCLPERGLRLFPILNLLTENIFNWLFFLFLLDVGELVVKGYDFKIFEVLFGLAVKGIAQLVFLFPLYTSLEMLKRRFLQLIDWTVHILGPWFLFRHDLSPHDIVMIAEPRNLVLDNFRPSIFCTAVCHVYELVLIKWVDWYVFFLSYF